MDVQHFALKTYVEFLGSVGRLTCSVMRTVTPKPSDFSFSCSMTKVKAKDGTKPDFIHLFDY